MWRRMFRLAGLRARSNHMRMRPAAIVDVPWLSRNDQRIPVAQLGGKNGRKGEERDQVEHTLKG